MHHWVECSAKLVLLPNAHDALITVHAIVEHDSCNYTHLLLMLMQVMSEMLAAHVLSHYDKFLEGVNTIATFERELQASRVYMCSMACSYAASKERCSTAAAAARSLLMPYPIALRVR